MRRNFRLMIGIAFVLFAGAIHAQEVDSLPGVYTYDCNCDTYISNLALNEDSTFYFSTVGCFTDEQTEGTWKYRDQKIFLNSFPRLKDTLIIYSLDYKNRPEVEGFLFEILDTNNIQYKDVKVKLMKDEKVLDSAFTDAKGICKLKGDEANAYEVSIPNYPTRRILISNLQGKVMNYNKIMLRKIPDTFFIEKEFQVVKGGLQGDDEHPFFYERYRGVIEK